MKTFAIRGGDLVLSGSRYGMVEGIARAQQQISLALREEYGSDRFHPEWGCTLPAMIGSVIDSATPAEIRSEVTRVVRLFIVRQNELIKQRAAAGRRSVVKPEELIAEISSIRTETNQDQVLVKVVIRTVSNQEFSILTSPGST